MEHQHTFKSCSELAAIIHNSYSRNENVYMIVEKQGLERVEGLITAIINSLDDDNYIYLNYDNKIFLTEIIALNGIFREDYAEC